MPSYTTESPSQRPHGQGSEGFSPPTDRCRTPPCALMMQSSLLSPTVIMLASMEMSTCRWTSQIAIVAPIGARAKTQTIALHASLVLGMWNPLKVAVCSQAQQPKGVIRPKENQKGMSVNLLSFSARHICSWVRLIARIHIPSHWGNGFHLLLRLQIAC
jgi:hypothetical protein